MLKPIDPDATIGVICVLDDAIDSATEGFETFFGKTDKRDDTGIHIKSPEKWREHITSKPGEKITEYIIGTIPSARMNEIQDKYPEGDDRHFWECFLWSLRDIVDGPTMETTDPAGRPKAIVPKLPDGRVDPEWLEKIFIRAYRKIALNIGMHAYIWQRFGADDARP